MECRSRQRSPWGKAGGRSILGWSRCLLLAAAWIAAAAPGQPARAQLPLPPAPAETGSPLLTPLRPPRPASPPQEAEVADLGRNDRLPDALLPFFRPPQERQGSDPLLAALAALIPGQPLVLLYPLERRAIEVNPYGWRYAESRNSWRIHPGIDLIADEGTAVRAALPGTVRLVEMVSGYGLTVVIDHGRGWQSLYAHLLDLAVMPQQMVAAGEVIGRVGGSGQASTPHLHFELRHRQAERIVALDPAPLFDHTPLLEASR